VLYGGCLNTEEDYGYGLPLIMKVAAKRKRPPEGGRNVAFTVGVSLLAIALCQVP
jgi:hypothetical protein